DPEVRPLAEDLSRTFIALVELSEPARRRIVKFAYNQDFDPSLSLGVRLGWRALSLRFPTPAVAFTNSYHLEFEVPSGIESLSTRLLVANPTGRPHIVETGASRQRAHVY